MTTTNDIIVHHGILGQKWGVRNGPPYPLKNRSYSTHKVEGQKLKYDSPFKQELRRDLKTFPHAMAAALIPGYGLAYNSAVVANNSKYWSKKIYDQKQTKLSELNKKSEAQSTDIMKDLKDTNKTGKRGYVKNCFNCVSALEMRQRGYDVVASPRSQGALTTEYGKMFSNVKYNGCNNTRQPKESRKKFVERSYKNLCDQIEKVGPGARGFLTFSYEGANSGHTVMWFTNKSGEVSFIDPQSGSKNTTNTLALSTQNYTWGRLDNCKISDSITQVVENRKGKK